MKKVVLAGVLFLAAVSAVFAQGPKGFSERLDGYQEDLLTISTAGKGQFHGRISNDGLRFAWELKYSNLVDVLAAHIHFGGHAQNGGIIAFLCADAGGPPGTPACPDAPATISGVIEAADIVGPVGQGIAAGEFAEFLRALRADTTYVNVHTTLYPGGEIRANIGGPGQGQGHGKGHDDD